MATTEKRDSMDASTTGLETKLKTTHLQKATPEKPQLWLADLPASVRNNIYKYALDTELVNAGETNVAYTHSIKDGVLHFRASRPPFPVQTSLFYVNKNLSKEALHYFYSSNLFVRFEIYSSDARHAKTMLEDSGLLFSTAPPNLLDHSTQHALNLTIVEKNSTHKRATVMFPAQYLPRLINFLSQASSTTKSWAPAHSLSLTVLTTYTFPLSRLQGDLLEPFRLLANIGSAAIDATHLLPGYAQGLQTSMTAPSFSPDAWLKTITSLADLSDAAREKEKYETAVQYNHAAVIALTHAYLTHPETLHTQPDPFTRAIQRLRWRTELALGIGLSLLHRSAGADAMTPSSASALLLAESSLSRALSLATDAPSPASNPWFASLPVELIPANKNTWFSDAERAQTWYALGAAHAALGENLFAAGDMERALGLWGHAEGRARVEGAFEQVRARIDAEMAAGGVQPGRGLSRASRLALHSTRT
jgi:hypothetical protein